MTERESHFPDCADHGRAWRGAVERLGTGDIVHGCQHPDCVARRLEPGEVPPDRESRQSDTGREVVPTAHHILIAGDTGPEIVRDDVSGKVVLNIPTTKPLDLADGRRVVSIGLDADAIIAMATVMQQYGETVEEAIDNV